MDYHKNRTAFLRILDTGSRNSSTVFIVVTPSGKSKDWNSIDKEYALEVQLDMRDKRP